jgi:hypothetical protein
MNRIIAIAGALAATLAATSAHALGEIVSAVAATVDANGQPGNGNIADTFNQNGLLVGYTSGVTNFNAYIAGNPRHTAFFGGNEFFGNDETTALTVTYDLGSVQSIDALALWNEETSGIGVFDLLASTDGVTFTALLSGVTPFDNPVNSVPDYGAEVFTFGLTSARYFQIAASDCPQPDPGDFPGCAIGEVAFRAGVIPEPGVWALMIVGFGLTGFAMRRRAMHAAA